MQIGLFGINMGPCADLDTAAEVARLCEEAGFDFADIDARPRPLQQPGPPVVFGGHVPQAYARAVTHAQGWYGFGLDLERTRQCLDGLAAARAAHRRPDASGPLEISVTPAGNLDLDMAKRYAELGVDRLIVLFPRSGADALFSLTVAAPALEDYVKRLGDSVVGRA